MHITLIYGGMLGLLFLLLSFWVVKRRAQFKVMIGEGEAPEMLSAIRAHGNFAEYVPLALLMLALLELAGTAAAVVWTCGLVLLLARLAHAIGLGGSAGYSAGRFGGTLLTLAVLLAMALLGLWRFLAQAAL